MRSRFLIQAAITAMNGWLDEGIHMQCFAAGSMNLVGVTTGIGVESFRLIDGAGFNQMASTVLPVVARPHRRTTVVGSSDSAIKQTES